MIAAPRSALLGIGSSVPETVLSNKDLEAIVETSDDWITSRTGIKERRRLAPTEGIADHGEQAARRALEDAGLTTEDLDCIICCTYTGDNTCPSTACELHNRFGVKDIPAMDLNAACSGFMYGLQVADSFVRVGLYKNILVVGLDGQTRYVNYTDRTTCILFGDGAGAVIVGEAPADGSRGILGTFLGADGRGAELIKLGSSHEETPADAPPATNTVNRTRYIEMAGREVFKFAVRGMGNALDQVLTRAGATPSDIDMLIPHQANIRIIDAAAARLDLPRDRVEVNIERFGNTAAASIPLAMDEAYRGGRLKRGMTVALVGFGGGFTYGSVLLRW